MSNEWQTTVVECDAYYIYNVDSVTILGYATKMQIHTRQRRLVARPNKQHGLEEWLAKPTQKRTQNSFEFVFWYHSEVREFVSVSKLCVKPGVKHRIFNIKIDWDSLRQRVHRKTKILMWRHIRWRTSFIVCIPSQPSHFTYSNRTVEHTNKPDLSEI